MVVQQWYVVSGGFEHGPYPPAEIKRQADDGKITRETPLRHEDLDHPVVAGRLKGLFPPEPEHESHSEQDDFDDAVAAHLGLVAAGAPNAEACELGTPPAPSLEPEPQPVEPTRPRSTERHRGVRMSKHDKRHRRAMVYRTVEHHQNPVLRYLRFLLADAVDWAGGANWLLRLPIYAWMGVMFYQLVTKDLDLTPLRYLETTVHEMGHWAFFLAPTWIGCPMGTIAQHALPLYGIGCFLKQRDYFAASFGLVWLASTMQYTAWYMQDTLLEEGVPLQALGEDIDYIHDFQYMFGKLHVIPYSIEIGQAYWILACVIATLGLLLGAWLLFRMVFPKPDELG